jgi:hypothetical protein
MLKAYEVIITKDQIQWQGEKPETDFARAIITILEELPTSVPNETTEPIRRRFPPASMAGTVKILGDIVSPIVDEEDWECLK